MEGLFHVFGTGGLGLAGKIAHDVALGGSEVHFLQRGGHGLIGAPVEDPDQMAIVAAQNDHLLKM